MDFAAQTAPSPAPQQSESSFYIPATGPATRPRRSLKYGDTFLVVDSHGDIGAVAGGSDGLFHNDTRFLSRLALTVNELQPLLLASNVRDDNALLAIDLTNPDVYADERIVLEKDTLHIVRTIFLWRGSAYQRLGIRNYGEQAIDLHLSIDFASDFVDLFEVRGMHRTHRGTMLQPVIQRDHVVLAYRGLDRKIRRTTLSFDPLPGKLTANQASYEMHIEPGEMSRAFVSVSCEPPNEKPAPFLRALAIAHRELRNDAHGVTTVESSNELLNEILCRSAADLAMLTTDTPQGRYPYAGIPWYSTTFGRDGLITALQMLWCNPSLARGVLRRLAAYQAQTTDSAADAEPGKILHEMRAGEMANLGEVPFGLYYGSVDATPLFVLLAGLYAERTGDLDTIRELWPAIEAALAWIDGVGDRDGDGFIEYQRATDRGLANQGWKDSEDAIFHADGTLATGTVALAEVQGYVFAAKRSIARCARRLGRNDHAASLEEEAERLAERFEASFWCPDIDTYAIALDGEKRPCAVLTSNAGQVLFSGIANADRARSVAAGLMGPRFFSGWGIRTVAKDEPRFNPMSYHNGSIWPHDNALISLGLARYGCKQAVAKVFAGLFDAATYMDLRRLPELFCGFQRQRGRGPTLYPVACSPQAWASATPFTLLEASLGLEFDPGNHEIRLRNPCLPSFVDEVLLRNLQLGAATIDLLVRRLNDKVALDISHQRGKVQVSVVFSP